MEAGERQLGRYKSGNGGNAKILRKWETLAGSMPRLFPVCVVSGRVGNLHPSWGTGLLVDGLVSGRAGESLPQLEAEPW